MPNEGPLFQSVQQLMAEQMPTVSNEKISHTIPGLVASTGISRTKVFALIKTGQLEAVKIGGRTLVLDSSVRALLSKSTRVAA
jgi:predicted DNA-binding transcriptional regulator AlpA